MQSYDVPAGEQTRFGGGLFPNVYKLTVEVSNVAVMDTLKLPTCLQAVYPYTCQCVHQVFKF